MNAKFLGSDAWDPGLMQIGRADPRKKKQHWRIRIIHLFFGWEVTSAKHFT